MRHDRLRKEAHAANMAIRESGLVVLTWGNASAVDRAAGVVAIKPSGVSYDALSPEHIVVLDLATGAIVDGDMNPSSDTPTHLALYRGFERVGAIVHTHSTHATSWAQAASPIPCLGTTHADHFHGPVPVTRPLTDEEIAIAYEENTGRVIVEHFRAAGIDPSATPAVLLPFHGPFTWGADAAEAARNALVLEEIARMAMHTYLIRGDARPAPDALVRKHYLRKHGPGAYYGQKGR